MSIPVNLGVPFGDGLERISLTESLRNAQINNGVEDFMLTENDWLSRIPIQISDEYGTDD
jgi:hypothetical protein